MSAAMNTCKIPVVAAFVAKDEWFAFSPDIPWLAAEGDSFEDLIRRIEKIAPVLVRLHGISIPFSLAWRAVPADELAADYLARL